MNMRTFLKTLCLAPVGAVVKKLLGQGVATITKTQAQIQAPQLKRVYLTNEHQIFPGLTVKFQNVSVTIERQCDREFEWEGQFISNPRRDKWYARDESGKQILCCFDSEISNDVEFYV